MPASCRTSCRNKLGFHPASPVCILRLTFNPASFRASCGKTSQKPFIVADALWRRKLGFTSFARWCLDQFTRTSGARLVSENKKDESGFMFLTATERVCRDVPAGNVIYSCWREELRPLALREPSSVRALNVEERGAHTPGHTAYSGERHYKTLFLAQQSERKEPWVIKLKITGNIDYEFLQVQVLVHRRQACSIPCHTGEHQSLYSVWVGALQRVAHPRTHRAKASSTEPGPGPSQPAAAARVRPRPGHQGTPRVTAFLKRGYAKTHRPSGVGAT